MRNLAQEMLKSRLPGTENLLVLCRKAEMFTENRYLYGSLRLQSTAPGMNAESCNEGRTVNIARDQKLVDASGLCEGLAQTTSDNNAHSPFESPSKSPLTGPDATIVVATFNRQGSINLLLQDLTNQTSSRFDVIIVNDGGSVAVEQEVPSVLPFRVQLINRDNGGPAAARHTAIEATNAAIVIILDDDMRVDPGFVNAHLAAHDAGADVVYGRIESKLESEEALFTAFHNQHIERWIGGYEQGASPKGELLCTGNVSFTKHAYEAVGGFDRSLLRLEDRDLGIRLQAAGFAFMFAPAGRSVHASDHHDVAVWRDRSRVYGRSEVKIFRKHPDRIDLSPWHFLSVLPRISHPILLVSALLPSVGGWLGSLTYRVAEQIGVSSERRRSIAIRLAGFTYGIDYFSGVGLGCASRREILADVTSSLGGRRSLGQRRKPT